MSGRTELGELAPALSGLKTMSSTDEKMLPATSAGWLPGPRLRLVQVNGQSGIWLAELGLAETLFQGTKLVIRWSPKALGRLPSSGSGRMKGAVAPKRPEPNRASPAW